MTCARSEMEGKRSCRQVIVPFCHCEERSNLEGLPSRNTCGSHALREFDRGLVTSNGLVCQKFRLLHK